MIQYGHNRTAQYIWEKSGLQEAVEAIPMATKAVLQFPEEPSVSTGRFRGVHFLGEMVGAVGKGYALVQHKDAFAPIVKGLENSGAEYDWRMDWKRGRAWLDVATFNAADTVKIGFRAMNSIDGSTAIKYGFNLSRVHGYVELVGYRKVCSNGMMVRVPLDNAEIVKKEVRGKLEELMAEQEKIIHRGQPEAQIEAVQFVVEAVALLGPSVNRMIEKAAVQEMGKKEARELINKYIGKRLEERLMGQFDRESPTLWGLYNAVTNVATHGKLAKTTAEGLMRRSAKMLTEAMV